MVNKIKAAGNKVAMLFGNTLINKIPVRVFRNAYYYLLGAKIGKGSILFRRVELIDPRHLSIGKESSVGWFTLLDARGGYRLETM